MIVLNFFTNIVFYYFPDELALFHTMMSWACSRRIEGKTQPIILIVIFFSDELVPHQMSWLLSTSWLRGWPTILSSSNDKIDLFSTV